jgi:hypothetical protein
VATEIFRSEDRVDSAFVPEFGGVLILLSARLPELEDLGTSSDLSGKPWLDCRHFLVFVQNDQSTIAEERIASLCGKLTIFESK